MTHSHCSGNSSTQLNYRLVDLTLGLFLELLPSTMSGVKSSSNNLMAKERPSQAQSPKTSTCGGRLAVLLATGLGVGLVAPAPGTVGGLWGLPLAWIILQIPAQGGQLALILAIGLVSVPICAWATRVLGVGKDPQAIVLDEIVSVPIVFFALPDINMRIWLAGYLLLRIFDIAKPPPVNLLERLPDGWGIMADDMMAGIYAAVALRGLLWCDTAAGMGIISS